MYRDNPTTEERRDDRGLDTEQKEAPAEERHELLKSKSNVKQYTESEQKRKGCPVYFGVKSYLHEFYEQHSFKDPKIYEDDDDVRYLLNPGSRRRRRCPPVWLKICVWVGVNLLLFGMIGIIVGYFVPEERIINKITKTGNNVAFVDRGALRYNTALDLCKLVGLIFFCVGGILLASSLLFPSFLASRCEEDHLDEGILVSVGDEKGPPRSPVDMTIPSTSKLKNVQPDPSKTQTMRSPPPQDDDVTVKD